MMGDPQSADSFDGRAQAEPARVLRVRRLSKSFPGVKALDGVSLDVVAGEIVSIVGQNGSGKSTFVKVLAGLYPPDPGAMIEHQELRFIHQDLGLVSMLSTVENLDIGHRLGTGALLPVRGQDERRAAEEAVRRFGGDFDVAKPVGELAAAERAIVAIARAMADWSPPDGVVLLDEPTAALGGEEVDRLFAAVRTVADAGAGVVFISHRLDEVLGLSDRIVALRDGRVVADVPASEVDHERLVSLIAGRAIAETKIAHHEQHGPTALRVESLVAATVRGVDLEVRKGEIVGVTGLLGSGRDDLTAAIFGAVNREAGEVSVAGLAVPASDPTESIRHGLALLPADRLRHGGVMTLSARENLTLPSLALAPRTRAFAPFRRRLELRETADWISRVELQPPLPERPLQLFSGGNQQKIVIAKCLKLDPKVLLLDEPTQGVDVGAKAAIYALVNDAAVSGTGILVSSSDLKELITLCDRVLVLRDGRVATELKRDELSEHRLVSENLGLNQTDSRPTTLDLR
jgi:ABC-type sugar transport system ATPase subunit